ncbi:MAG TPA: glycosyltransferase family 2 protein [Candidatus Omnitrophota bacterium]|nr:glycosyltransferase family 2 protein [Candidatus Omnitrophota bacterium]HPD83930.1 glycosyltransferase family 2 protein [Candidatus Omnitrophota bacterium]HRZ02787.1 glycosyltransferase family 2 protein [Candidatus Omnitrophota bacterium]
MKTCIVIPVHNEAAVIGQLIEKLKNLKYDVVVIDDGSTDDSGLIARKKGAVVIVHPVKKGKGLSLRDGFDYAVKENYDAVIALDGDGQHAVEDIAQFIEKSKEMGVGIVTGSRMQDYKGMPWVRLWVNRMMSAVISSICKQSIPDTQCGFRLISVPVLRQVRLSSSDFEIESEVLIKASKKGFKIHSVPVKTIYQNEVSKINPFKDTIRFFVYLFKEMRGSDS